MNHGKQLPLSCLYVAVAFALGITAPAAAESKRYYETSRVLVPPDQWAAGGSPRKLTPAPVYKPHDTRTSLTPNWWLSSNERTGCAGISVFHSGSDHTLANVIIDEPEVEYEGGDEATGTPCVGSIYVPPDTEEPPEGEEPPEDEPPGPEDQFPVETRFNPTVCLPVVLPPGQTEVTYTVEDVDGTEVSGTVRAAPPDDLGRARVCAPLGAERHARHPHGVTVDGLRDVAYQVIEHSGLRWNADRSAFEIAETTDEESGFTLAWDVSDPEQPEVLNGYLNGHGAHEVVVNLNNGLVFQGNHEDSHGVYPPNWVDVIDPTKANPYGFIDVGYFHPIQGIDVDERRNQVFGATHVGEKVFVFDGSCVPAPNPTGVEPPPPPPGYTLPADDTGMTMGWNCIKWWTEIRPAFLAAFPELAGVLDPTAVDANVLHQHNLVVDDEEHRAYATIHSIHDAEHTGLPEDEPPVVEGSEEETEAGHHYMGRYVVEVGEPGRVDRRTKEARAKVRIIDLSNGFDLLDYPNVDEITGGLRRLQNSFVHGHFLAVDPDRDLLLVSGEHTGNLGVVDLEKRRLVQVLPISLEIKGCVPPPPEPGAPPEAEEPHVHGVVVEPQTGTVYVSDEGEHCFYESVTVLRPTRKADDAD